MDPLSITASVTALVTLCSQVFMLCSRIPGKKSNLSRTLINLSMEVSTYQTALLQMQLLLTDQDGLLANILGAENEWTKSFDAALSGSSITMSVLVNSLEKELKNCTGNLLRSVLKEQDLIELIGELRGQQQGVQFLATTLQLKSTSEVFQLLKDKHATLESIHKHTALLSETWGVRNSMSASSADDAFSVFNLDMDDKVFEFDEELSNLGPYLRALSGQKKPEVEVQQLTANLIEDFNLIDLSTESDAPGRWLMELHEEYLPGPSMLIKDGDAGLEHLAERRLLLDTEKELFTVVSDPAPVLENSPSYSDKEAVALEEIEVRTVAGSESSAGQSIGNFSITTPKSSSSSSIFQLHHDHLVLAPGFQQEQNGLDSTGSVDGAALQWAAVHGSLNDAKVIRRRGSESLGQSTCKINTFIADKSVAFDGWTELSLASYFGHLHVVEYFLENTTSTTADRYQVSSRSKSRAIELLSPLFAAIATAPYLLLSNSISGSSSPSSNATPNQDILAIRDLKRLRTQRPDLWQYPAQPSGMDDKRINIVHALIKFDHRAFKVDVQDKCKLNLLQAAACGTSLSMVVLIMQLRGKLLTGQKRFLSKLKGASDVFLDSPLHLAAFWNRTQTVEYLLQQKGTNPNAVGYRKRTPLHYAAAMGNPEVIRLLCRAKATVDVWDSEDIRPMDLAFRWGQFEAMKALIVAGSDLSWEDSYPRDHQIVKETILHTAVRQDNSSKLQAVTTLLENGASPNYPNNLRQTPLHFAATTTGAQVEVINCLIAHKGDPNARDSDGNTPLLLVLMKGSTNGKAHLAVRALLNANANPYIKNHLGKDAAAITRECISAKKTASKTAAEIYFLDDYLGIVDMLADAMPGAIRRQSTVFSLPSPKLG